MHTDRRWKSYLLISLQFAFLLGFAAGGSVVASGAFFIVQLLALALAGWAVLTLRPGNFNVTPDVPVHARFVARGPYRSVRHPMYTSLLLATVPLLWESPVGGRLVLWLGLLGTLVAKLQYEESLLAARFPEYRQYREKTKRLVPFLY